MFYVIKHKYSILYDKVRLWGEGEKGRPHVPLTALHTGHDIPCDALKYIVGLRLPGCCCSAVSLAVVFGATLKRTLVSHNALPTLSLRNMGPHLCHL